MAKSAQVPILPMLIFGAFELWPPKQLTITPGRVTLRFMPPLMPAEFKDLDKDELSEKVRKQMLFGMASTPSGFSTSTGVSKKFLKQHYLALMFLSAFCLYVSRWLLF